MYWLYVDSWQKKKRMIKPIKTIPFFLIFVAALLSLSSCGLFEPEDPKAEKFVQIYHLDGPVIGYSVQQTEDGGYIITGYGEQGGHILLMKTDAKGDSIWTRFIDDYYAGHTVRQTADGGYIILCKRNTNPAIIKTDALGNVEWRKTLLEQSMLVSLELSSSGGYIMSGLGVNPERPSYFPDLLILKTDANGTILWESAYGDSVGDIGRSIQEANDGGYIVTGSAHRYASGWPKVWLLKTDEAGDTLWTRIYGGEERGEGFAVKQTEDGGYVILAGFNEWGDLGWGEMRLIKTDANGNVIWSSSNEGGLSEELFALEKAADDGYVIFGAAMGRFVIRLTKVDESGESDWTRYYGDGEDSRIEGYSIQRTSDGGYIMTGYINRAEYEYEYDLLLIKTDEHGYTKSSFMRDKPPPPTGLY